MLLADHELAASTVAARVAASVRADPYAVASAGLAVVSGTLHGGASLGIEALLDEIDRPDQAASVVGAEASASAASATASTPTATPEPRPC